MYPAYEGSFSCTDTALTSALRLLARWMPAISARPDSGDSSYATRILLNIFGSLLTLRERLQFPLAVLRWWKGPIGRTIRSQGTAEGVYDHFCQALIEPGRPRPLNLP